MKFLRATGFARQWYRQSRPARRNAYRIKGATDKRSVRQLANVIFYTDHAMSWCPRAIDSVARSSRDAQVRRVQAAGRVKPCHSAGFPRLVDECGAAH